ncbi:hypothetical protein C8E03_108117 [Lachnotalea glycerini]|uniref:Uncharacterized protein n=1 Tax=Lachnotalea glycerini TaxID=1763509 RepID=A0A318EQM4_9FIRM|nr:hypothetical protein [Lachnotalea glycerini]PXV88390.1 hypothetical protein C8E03_108117 [Lachnotalea glycerini]
MKMSDYHKAKSVVEKLDELKQLRDSFSEPCEGYYTICFTFAGQDTKITNDSIGEAGIRNSINNMKQIIDAKIKELEKELEEI